jgi:hypothetical protein
MSQDETRELLDMLDSIGDVLERDIQEPPADEPAAALAPERPAPRPELDFPISRRTYPDPGAPLTRLPRIRGRAADILAQFPWNEVNQ